ncbi:MAG: PD40 domain-containing protein [Anaerolineaceae bacterium]|nr:PD40 domain-containing protein [Anaerolineaceae bacterium]
MKSTPFLLVIMALIFASLACSLTGSGTKTPSADEIATQVAATVAAQLTAITGGIPTTETLTPTAEAPAPTATPAPPPVLRLFYNDGAGNLWSWSESGGARQLTFSGGTIDLVAAPDGSRVAYVKSSDYLNHSLWVINNDGSGERQLVSIDEFSAMKTDPAMQGLAPDFLAWTPDGSSLVFTTTPKYEGPGYTLQDDLWMVNASSGERHQILAPGVGGAFYFSPDGSKMALVKPDRISIANTDGSDLRQVFTYTPVTTYSEYAYRAEPVWSPDSSSLWVAIPPEDPLSPGQPTTLWRVPVNDSPPTRLGSINVNFLTPVALSADQTRILYIGDGAVFGDNNTEVHIANADGSGDSLFFAGEAGSPLTWSPDGLHFTFVISGAYNTQIGQVGGSHANLSDTGMAAAVRWLDNSTYLFLNRTAAGWEIRRATIGSPSSALVYPPGDPAAYFLFYGFAN